MYTENSSDNNSNIYLDNAASTPVLDEVVQEMIPYLKEIYGNPSSIHRFGRETSRAITLARKRVALLINARHSEIIFTSGGTEADNLAIKGFAYYAKKKNPSKNHIITSSIEHEAVLEPCRELEREGFEVTYLPVSHEGMVDPSDLEKAISEKTLIVSIMLANNEIGTIQPIPQLVKVVRLKAGNTIAFHSDAVQAAGKIPVDVKVIGVDLLSISSHKINGPKGVGALYVRDGIKLNPEIHGGGQEHLIRSGTENVHGIVGFGKACEIAAKRLDQYISTVTQLRRYLIERVLKDIPDSRLNGSSANRLPGNAHLTFLGVNGEDLIIKLDEAGIAASTGSACSVKKQRPSHVLKAMGFSYEEVTGSLRITLGSQNTFDEIDRTVANLTRIIKELRDISPFKTKYSF